MTPLAPAGLRSSGRALSNSESDAESIFLRAIDRNFVSRLAIEVAVTLGVIDQILGGVTAVRELASACGADPDALRRLLRLLEVRELVQMNGDEFVYVTDAGAVCVGDSNLLPWRSILDLGGMGRRMDEAVFHGLLSSIRTGEPAYERVHGLPFWDDMKARGLAASFQDHMRRHLIDIAPEVASLPRSCQCRLRLGRLRRRRGIVIPNGVEKSPAPARFSAGASRGRRHRSGEVPRKRAGVASVRPCRRRLFGRTTGSRRVPDCVGSCMTLVRTAKHCADTGRRSVAVEHFP